MKDNALTFEEAEVVLKLALKRFDEACWHIKVLESKLDIATTALNAIAYDELQTPFDDVQTADNALKAIASLSAERRMEGVTDDERQT